MSVVHRVWRDQDRLTLWRRCDMCRWSGPSPQFVDLFKDGHHADVCRHAWCWGEPALREQLLSDGWKPVFEGEG